MLANFHMCGIVLLFLEVLDIPVENANPRGPLYFKCLMFGLSGFEISVRYISVYPYTIIHVPFKTSLS